MLGLVLRSGRGATDRRLPHTDRRLPRPGAVHNLHSLSWQLIGQSWVFLVSGMVMGLAFGAAILLSAPAIVIYLRLPIIWYALVNNISALDGVSKWLSASNTLSPLTQQPLSGTQWIHALATLAFWIGIPILIGWARIGRGDLD